MEKTHPSWVLTACNWACIQVMEVCGEDRGWSRVPCVSMCVHLCVCGWWRHGKEKREWKPISEAGPGYCMWGTERQVQQGKPTLINSVLATRLCCVAKNCSKNSLFWKDILNWDFRKTPDAMWRDVSFSKYKKAVGPSELWPHQSEETGPVHKIELKCNEGWQTCPESFPPTPRP